MQCIVTKRSDGRKRTRCAERKRLSMNLGSYRGRKFVQGGEMATSGKVHSSGMVWHVWHVWHVWQVDCQKSSSPHFSSEFLYRHNNVIMVQNFIFNQMVSFIGAFQSKLPADTFKKQFR